MVDQAGTVIGGCKHADSQGRIGQVATLLRKAVRLACCGMLFLLLGLLGSQEHDNSVTLAIFFNSNEDPEGRDPKKLMTSQMKFPGLTACVRARFEQRSPWLKPHGLGTGMSCKWARGRFLFAVVHPAREVFTGHS